MSFWTLSNNETAQGGDYESQGGDFTPIPNGTKCISAVEEVKLTSYEGEDYFNLKWRILDGDYKNRVIFQKLKVFSQDTKTRDKAITVLASIDSNCGGKLMSSGKEPTEISIATAICNKPMIILLRVWTTEDKSKTGNWIAGIFGRNKTSATASGTTAETTSIPGEQGFDEDIGF